MITAAINILIYAILMLLIGLYKPKWALFWMKEPSRIIVIVIALVLFMIAATLFGEGNRAKQVDINQPTEIIEVPTAQPTKTEKLPQ
jgi:undecaprenyl pyrophosphate phosphatase UppP